MTKIGRSALPGRGRWKLAERILPLALLLLALILGVAIADDFGMSWDEPLNVGYARWALDQYRGAGLLRWTQGAEFTKGPFYFILYSKAGELLARWLPSWTEANGRHFTNYLTFLLAVISFRSIARRFVGRRAAWISTLLFATQPLLFGHAFINQKDIPFMAFFTATVALGLWAVDRFVDSDRGRDDGIGGEISAAIQRDLKSREILHWVLAASGVIGIVALELALFGERLILPYLQSLVRQAHAGAAPLPADVVFRWVAANATSVPVDRYLEELQIRYVQMTWLSLPVSSLALVALLRWVLPVTMGRLGVWIGPWLVPVAVAAVCAGLTISLREAGPLAGLLVAIYLLVRAPRRGLVVLFVYGLCAALAAYVTWPSLWGNPIGKLLERVVRVSDFPQTHGILYRGRTVLSTELPWHYFPWLTAIQLTIPTLLCLAAGMLFLRKGALSHRDRRWPMILMLIWLLVPLVAILATGAGAYGNIRHLLFALPPLFVVAGLGIDGAIGWMGYRWAPALLAALLILPAAIAIYRGHPYQYVYYNQLVGGVAGAEGRYELDHWCTSHQQAMAYVNQKAPEGSLVTVRGAVEVARAYAREDLRVEHWKLLTGQPDYGVDCGPELRTNPNLAEMSVVYQVVSRGAVLNQVSVAR